MKRRILYLLPVIILLIGTAAFFSDAHRTRSAVAPEATVSNQVAAPGRIEPVSEEIAVSSEISGRLAQMLADEGAHIRKGAILAVLDNSEYRALVASAEAALQQRQAELKRLANGARPQEREQARIAIEATQTVLENARAEMDRRKSLLTRGAVSQEEFDRSQREYRIAESRFRDAVEQNKLIDAGAREEELERARAEVHAAEAHLAEARAYMNKTLIRSPISGVILRRYAKVGESVSNSLPVFTIADDSVIRVRADVDEVDVARVSLGQSAFVKADAFGDATFPGKVVRISPLLGKKNIVSDQPKERMDNKILEVLIELEDGHRLPMGLRVDAFIKTGPKR